MKQFDVHQIRELGVEEAGPLLRRTQAVQVADGTVRQLRFVRAQPALSACPGASEAFCRAARCAVGLVHPVAMAVVDFGMAPDGPVVAYDRAEDGAWLPQLLAANGSLPPLLALHVLRELCGLVAAAHSFQLDGAPLVHGGIRAERVRVRGDGRLQLGEFGLTGGVPAQTLVKLHFDAGDVHTLTPELLAHQTLSPAADIYALGVLMYRLLSGSEPFLRGSALQSAFAVQAGERGLPLPEATPPGIAAATDKMLHKDPRQRFANARELIGVLDGLPGHAAGAQGLAQLVDDLRRSTRAPRTEAPVAAPIRHGFAKPAEHGATNLQFSVPPAALATPSPASKGTRPPEGGTGGFRRTQFFDLKAPEPAQPRAQPAPAPERVAVVPARRASPLSTAEMSVPAGFGVPLPAPAGSPSPSAPREPEPPPMLLPQAHASHQAAATPELRADGQALFGGRFSPSMPALPPLLGESRAAQEPPVAPPVAAPTASSPPHGLLDAPGATQQLDAAGNVSLPEPHQTKRPVLAPGRVSFPFGPSTGHGSLSSASSQPPPYVPPPAPDPLLLVAPRSPAALGDAQALRGGSDGATEVFKERAAAPFSFRPPPSLGEEALQRAHAAPSGAAWREPSHTVFAPRARNLAATKKSSVRTSPLGIALIAVLLGFSLVMGVMLAQRM